MQIYFLGGFLLLMMGYHILHTFFGFGVELLPPSSLSAGKDVLWVLLVCTVLITQRKFLISFLKERKGALLLLLILIVWAVGLSLFQEMSLGSILVGFKYDIYPLIVLISSVAVGYMSLSKKHIASVNELMVLDLLLVVLLVGLTWQVIKVLVPDFFYRFGYGPVGDYALGVSPPIWYRTGPGGMMRLQGIFAGPNNYGFFLVGISGIVSAYVLEKKIQRKSVLIALVYAGSLVWTLSRGAWIGAAIASALTVRYYFPAYKKHLLRGGILAGAAVLYISLLKSGSTSGHWVAFWEGIQAFLRQPWGYGLGMAGPSVHYEGVYLPENQYMQILLDLGLPGLVLRGGVFIAVIKKAVYSSVQHISAYNNRLVMLLFFGLCGLTVEGMFLHVWEDSMVNYLLLGVMGIMLGVLCKKN